MFAIFSDKKSGPGTSMRSRLARSPPVSAVEGADGHLGIDSTAARSRLADQETASREAETAGEGVSEGADGAG